jgi:pyridoxine 5-phosphate synthase
MSFNVFSMSDQKTRLSVNLNKVALIRNARGGNLPDLIQVARDCQIYGAEGITVHPRPDERHIRFSDLQPLKDTVQTEFNVEGYPSKSFIELMGVIRPHQCTLVPDPPGVLTSSEGWDTASNLSFLTEVVGRLKETGCRVSLFLDAQPERVEGVKESGADRIELYTGDFAQGFFSDKRAEIIKMHQVTAEVAHRMGLGVNAGHDLNLDNLSFYKSSMPYLQEVSIGHALISDALYYGLRNTVLMYRKQLL